MGVATLRDSQGCQGCGESLTWPPRASVRLQDTACGGHPHLWVAPGEGPAGVNKAFLSSKSSHAGPCLLLGRRKGTSECQLSVGGARILSHVHVKSA